MIEKFVTVGEYETLKALFKATSSDYCRMSLTKVFYSASRDQFIATDGHILRVESIAWSEGDKPSVDCYLDENQVSLSPRMILEQTRPDDFFDAKKVKKSGIRIGLRPCSESSLIYPNIASILEFKEPKELSVIGVSEEIVKRFFSSFPKGTRNHKLEFFGQLAGIRVSSQLRGMSGYKFSGIIMPNRILEE